jgi:hypothetical protein
MEVPFAHIWTMRNGKAIALRMFSDIERAKREVGIP